MKEGRPVCLTRFATIRFPYSEGILLRKHVDSMENRIGKQQTMLLSAIGR